jgi:hypothetical protein
MGPKKKTGEGDEDTSTQELLNHYRKCCKELEVPICKLIDTKINEAKDEDTHVPEILVNEKLGEFGARALSNALMRAK